MGLQFILTISSIIMKNIKYYPVQYTLTLPLLDFFTIITNDLALQDRLYHSETLSDVSRIAKEYGFDIPAADIQKAQAGRVLGIIVSVTCAS